MLYKKVPYDPVRDFAPITLAATAPNVLIVNPSVPAKTLAEFIALAKQKPGAMTYGTPGIGTSPHLCMELFKSMAGIDLQHMPYRGTAPAVTDVISGQIAAMFANALTAKPQVDAGTGARARGLRPQAHRGACRRAAGRRGRRAGLRGDAVVRAAGAGRHAAPDHRAAPRRGG